MKYILDMVHHNPGEAAFETRFLDADYLKETGFNGQVFKHINCVATYGATGINFFPEGSPQLRWINEWEERIRCEVESAKTSGLKVFYHIDLMVLPKNVVEYYGEEILDLQTGRIVFNRPRTKALHRVLFKEIAERFPEVDGYIIRVGETYLMDTPFHVGNGAIPGIGPGWSPDYLYSEILASEEPLDPRWSEEQTEAYVDLLQFLRREICEKREKTIIFRTWDTFPDKLHARLDRYLEITDRIEPHDKLFFSIKHTALDFWRYTKVNECLGEGKHPQIVEVQCQREYEGKGAYPNYVMDGVINGFEENAKKIGLKDLVSNPKIKGIYSWSRGGGWYGPYIKNELWPELNAYVLAQFAQDTARSEEELFYEFAESRLGLSGDDLGRFRELCLLSSRGILLGRHCEAFDRLLDESYLPTACWMRDDRLGGKDQLALVVDTLARKGKLDDALAEKTKAVEIWKRVSQLAKEITWPKGERGVFAKVSAAYGHLLFRVVEQGWRVLIYGYRLDQEGYGWALELKKSISSYEQCWKEYTELGSHPLCSTLYIGDYFSMPGDPSTSGMAAAVAYYKDRLSEGVVFNT